MTEIHWMNQGGSRVWIRHLCVAGLFLFLIACERQPEPIQVGMIANLTGRTADIGVAARDGAMLAVEQVNARGGIQGQLVELIVRDVENDPERARSAVKELVEMGVFVTVGPVLSSTAMVMAPLADELGMLLVSPTVTTQQLNEKDDLFLRVTSQCSDTSSALATYVYSQQYRRVSVIFDQGNKAFTESFKGCFTERFNALGGEVIRSVPYTSGRDQSFLALTHKAVEGNPDSLLILSSAIDAAMISQQVAKEQLNLPVFVSEWSFTHDLVSHGGRSVEGIVFLHNYNDQSKNPRYLKFVKIFEQRFGRKPSFPEVHAYDATRVTLDGLSKGARTGEALKREILKIGEFEALQTTFRMDRFGDVDRVLFLTEVRDGKFVVIGERRQKPD